MAWPKLSKAGKRRYAEKQRDIRLQKTFGISSAQWDKIFDLQGGKCPICLRLLMRPWNLEGKRTASVDHDHRTKRVRGLLCWQCNSLRVGNNTAEMAHRMWEYLDSDFDGRKV